MHLYLMLAVVGLGILIRFYWPKVCFRGYFFVRFAHEKITPEDMGTWADRWSRALGAFLVPSILLLGMSITVLLMGHHGMMLWHPVGWLGCHIVIAFLVIASAFLAYFLWQQWRSLRQIEALQSMVIANRTARVLETSALFAAQMGVWKPQLVVSQGLLDSLEAEQLEAVLSHEDAHVYYQDTLTFFWLNWVRRLTFWMPNTDALWQELLLLRELRADAWAAQRVDALTLAEALLFVAGSASRVTQHPCTAFYETTSTSRLEERIDFLLTQPELNSNPYQHWGWLILIALPLLLLPLHN